MASEDVIELGSSDEDTAEPAAKKKKPQPNAMVSIPGKLPLGADMTITQTKNAKALINPASILKGSGITITKVAKNNPLKVNPLANAQKANGNVSKGQQSSKSGTKRVLHIPVRKNVMLTNKTNNTPPQMRVNPLQLKNNLKASPKILPQGTYINKSLVRNPKAPHIGKIVLNNPVSVTNTNANKKSLINTNLPPGIIVTQTSSKTGAAKPKVHTLHPSLRVVSNLVNVQVKSTAPKLSPIKKLASGSFKTAKPTEVPIELDDDEPSQSSGPQWYLRPEEPDQDHQDPLADDTNAGTEKPEQKAIENTEKKSTEDVQTATESTTLEIQNNKEPDNVKFIEITIEDSPIKPAQNKKGYQVGAELAITIDDSPVRSKRKRSHHSDDDATEDSTKEPNSKKRLDYPVTDVQVVEIEFEPINTEECTENENEALKSPSSEKSSTKSTPSKDNGVENKQQKSRRSDENSRKSDKKCSSESPDTKEKEKSSNLDLDEAKSKNSDDKSIKCPNKVKEKPKIIESIDIVEIEESPIKPDDNVTNTTPKKNKISKPAYKISQNSEKPIEIIDLDEKDLNEFNTTYQSFIKLCLQLENSDDMNKIVEKKIKAYYRQVPKDYTESDVFIDMVGSKIMAMKAAPEKMYLYIKDVVDELNIQRKTAKAQPEKKEKNEEQERFLYGEESEFDTKRKRQIRKLEKTLKKLHRAIQKLEEQEVDFDDEDDSVYILTERYKDRAVRVHAKLCQLTNTKMPSEAHVTIEPRPGQHKGPSKKLEKWINRKVPIGTPLPFPDFHDVLRCVREANKEYRIGWNEADIMEEARDLFVRCGKKLQRRRQENEWRLAASRVPADAADPVEDDPELKRKLEDNRRLAAKKEIEVFNKYADRQKQLKLEAVEIGDKEAEESPVESDDEVEEVIEITDSATDKLKRKEKIKKLLQKSKVREENDVKQKGDDEKIDKSPEGDSSKENAQKDSNKDMGEDKGSSNKDKIGTETTKTQSKSNKTDAEVIESDDSEKGADGDNNLLQQRYSVPNNSSSDFESAIEIDTSSSDQESSDELGPNKKQSSDVISIENSSFSESEEKNDSVETTEKEDAEKDDALEQIDEVSEEAHVTDKNKNDEETPMDISIELDSVDKETENKEKTKNKIFKVSNDLSEDILLASSDEEEEIVKDNTDPDTCINLRDDNISIGETLIVENREIDGSDDSKEGKSDKNTDSSSIEGMEIGPETVSKECRLETVTEEIESIDLLSQKEDEDLEKSQTEHIPTEIETIDLETQKKTETSSSDTERKTTEIENVESLENTEELTEIPDGKVEKTDVTENVSETICLSSVESLDEENSNVLEKDTNEEDDDKQNTNDNVKCCDDIPKSIINEHDSEEIQDKTENIQSEKHILKETNENDENSEDIQVINEEVQRVDGKIYTNESSENANNLENVTKNIEQDTENQNGETIPTENKQDTNKTDTTDKNNENVSETKENNNSVPCEAMEVDSQDTL